MKNICKARWINTHINGHAGRALVMRYEGEPGYHVLAQIWPANEDKTRWFVGLFGDHARITAQTKRQAQSWARRDLKRLRDKLRAL